MWVGIYVIIMDWIGLGHKIGGSDWIEFRKLDPRPTLWLLWVCRWQRKCWITKLT